MSDTNARDALADVASGTQVFCSSAIADPKGTGLKLVKEGIDTFFHINQQYDGILLDAAGAFVGMTDPKALVNARAHTDWYRGDAPCDLSNWMASLADDTNVCDLWIPGTHDTMSDAGGDFAECQSWRLKKQLESGVRAFDIRFKHDGDRLQCVHGIIDMGYDCMVVINAVEAFLEAHPKEAIFMRVKRDDDSGPNTHPGGDFEQCFRSHLTKPLLWNFRGNAFGSLKDHRGQIFLLRFGSHLPIRDDHRTDIQDKYTIGNPDDKFQEIIDHANKPRSAGTMSINFTSSTGFDGKICYKCPGTIAYEVNKMVMDKMVMDANAQLKSGMYFMDFPGAKLMKDMLRCNRVHLPSGPVPAVPDTSNTI